MNRPFAVLKDINSVMEATETDQITVIFYAAKWSGNCHLVEPILQRLATKLKDSAKFFKVDTEEAKTLVEIYHISELPTLIFFASGKPLQRISGVTSEAEICKIIESLFILKPSKIPD